VTARLENIANNSSPALTCDDERAIGQLEASDYRSSRYLRRAGLWRLSSLPRLRCCGCRRASADSDVVLRSVDGVAGLAGLQSCGSVWVCPVCSAKIAARRALEVQAAVTAWYVLGGRVGFTTLTMRHHQGQGLISLWDGISGAWGFLTSGKSWQLARDRAGLLGWLRLVEVTHGRNGWHVHVHALLFLQADTDAAGLALFHDWAVARWARGLARRGFTCSPAGQFSKVLDLDALEQIADYFAKHTDAGQGLPGSGGRKPEAAPPEPGGPDARSIALEFTRSASKVARSALGTSSPFSLLDAVFVDGDADSLDLWHEWERGSKGRRQLTWSQGIREVLGLAADDQEDEEIAAEEMGSSDDDLIRIPSDSWGILVSRPVLIPRLLTATEVGGLAGARAFLDSHGIPYLLAGEGVK
jgi:hypothetical protein